MYVMLHHYMNIDNKKEDAAALIFKVVSYLIRYEEVANESWKTLS